MPRPTACAANRRDFSLGEIFFDFGPHEPTGPRFVDMTILAADDKLRR